jgi:iron-sulfur cluster repair protein YtfE (RIC family)
MSTLHVDYQAGPDTSCCSQQSAFQILLTCHEHIGQRLGTLEEVGRSLLEAELFNEHHLACLCDVLAFLDTAIPIHSADEEQSLFPRLKALPEFAGHPGATPMDCMEAEHAQHAELKAQLKAAIVKRNPAAAGRCAMTLAGEYRSHIQKEEEVLYPMATEMLTEGAVLDAMTEEMRERRREAGLLSC